jgi:hypothetical protein
MPVKTPTTVSEWLLHVNEQEAAKGHKTQGGQHYEDAFLSLLLNNFAKPEVAKAIAQRRHLFIQDSMCTSFATATY